MTESDPICTTPRMTESDPICTTPRITESDPLCTTPTKESKRRLEFSPSRSHSEDNILHPLAKRPNRKSFIEMLDSVTDDTTDPEKLKAREMLQNKTHLARSMLELRCRRVLPMLMRRKKILSAALNKPPAKDKDGEDKENRPQNVETLSDKVKVMKMQDSSCTKTTRNRLVMIL